MAVDRGVLSHAPSLVELLCCPKDRGPLTPDDGGLACPACGSHFPVRDGIVSFLTAQELTEQDHRERTMRDEESVWYDPMFEGYTNAVEVPAAVRRVDPVDGVILDAGCGTGRITEALVALGRPIIAVDYSEACLRRMLARTGGAPVLAVQSDLRRLPVKDGVAGAATCIEVYSQFRPDDRARILAEFRRVLAPGASLSISGFNYNVVFRTWRLLGNDGARQGEHMLGGDYHYQRFTRSEFRRELEAQFEVEELTGIRNIPARSIAAGMAKLRLRSAGDRFLRYMTDRGHAADFWLESTPLAGALGFFWQARCRRKAPTG
ncbi:MAG TPA: methyltransferase domain-containing protein [Acidimicrobiales bacterium]|nr:methyltransferase domain-containing protein [Acidimicrobiales bacterium]